MTTTPLQQVPVRSAAELTRRWTHLLDPPVFDARSLWLAWFDEDGIQVPVVTPVDELPTLPNRASLSGLSRLHALVVDQADLGEGHLAMALCRPGRPVITGEDDEWAEALREQFEDQHDGTWSLHLAADGLVLPVITAPRWRLP